MSMSKTKQATADFFGHGDVLQFSGCLGIKTTRATHGVSLRGVSRNALYKSTFTYLLTLSRSRTPIFASMRYNLVLLDRR